MVVMAATEVDVVVGQCRQSQCGDSNSNDNKGEVSDSDNSDGGDNRDEGYLWVKLDNGDRDFQSLL